MLELQFVLYSPVVVRGWLMPLALRQGSFHLLFLHVLLIHVLLLN